MSKPKITAPGVYELPMDVYHSQCCDGPSVSSSGLRTIENDSLKHFYATARGLNPDAPEPEHKPSLDFGKAVHALLFDDADEIARLVTSPYEAFRTNEAKAWRDEQHEAGRIIVTDDVLARIRGVHTALVDEPGCAELLTAGKPEQSMIWRDAETGIWLKSRPDRLPSDAVLADLKTTKSARPSSLERDIVNYGYHMQLGLAAMGMRALMDVTCTDAWLVFVESAAPHDVTMVRLGDELMDFGERQCRRAIRSLADAIEADEWPGYAIGPRTAHGPDWFHKKMQNEIERDLL